MADLTPERLAEIRRLAEGLRRDADYDIEDKRDIYQALMDLLDDIEHTRLTERIQKPR